MYQCFRYFIVALNELIKNIDCINLIVLNSQEENTSNDMDYSDSYCENGGSDDDTAEEFVVE